MLSNVTYHMRNKTFWVLDFFKGSKIRKAYREIKSIDSLDSRDKYIEDYQKHKFEELVNQATKFTEFYSEYSSKEDINSFPVINKSTLKSESEKFLSKNFDTRNLYTMATSGSTGTPFVTYQNEDKKRRVNAEVIYYSNKAGYKVGKNLIYLRAITDKSKKSPLKLWLQNETLIDISNLDDMKITKMLNKIGKSSKNGSMMLAYSSTYDSFKDYFDKIGFDMPNKSNLEGIVGSSEMFYEETRAKMEETFGCKTFSRYANQENGIIGQDEVLNNEFLINEANYIVEIFDMDEDKPLKHGEIGRIVITDLFNKAMPFIRYDTGDIGAIKFININGKQKKVISDFGGRRVDVVYDAKGHRLSPHIVTNNFWGFSEIKQYQFIQKNKKDYAIKLNVDRNFSETEKLYNLFLKLLGNEANISIEIVKEIPVLSSGKRKYIVNEMSQ